MLRFILIHLNFALLACYASLDFSSNANLPQLTKSPPNLPGGTSGVNLGDPMEEAKVNQVAGKALAESQAGTQPPDTFALIKVTDAASQVVAGQAYELQVFVGQAVCNTPQGSNSKPCVAYSSGNCPSCTINPTGKFGECYMKVTEQIWKNLTQVNKATCKEVPASLAMANR